MTTRRSLDDITSKRYRTDRLEVHVLARSRGLPCDNGDDHAGDGPVLVFIHGNVSSARFFAETMAALPPRFHALAPDLRGFGRSASAPIDATRGLRDFADDLAALLECDELELAGAPVHLIGWSAGAGVAMQYAIDHPARVASLVLEAPMSPYGFGGTRDAAGTPCWDDFAGSGAGAANPEFVQLLGARDTSEQSPFSPRNVMNEFYFKPPLRLDEPREETYVDEILRMAVGEDFYPGDTVSSPNWPGVAPGTRGVNNALSPKYTNLSRFADIQPRPPVLWIRGDDDQIVGDASMFDFGNLGKLGAIPGWPGDDVYRPQPMLAQTRAVLEAYRARGGQVREEVLPDVGHSPHIEAPAAFSRLVCDFVDAAAGKDAAAGRDGGVV